MTHVRNSHAEYGCAVFADNLRTLTYHEWAKDNQLYPEECCPEMQDCSCPNDDPLTPYTDPVTDAVPWLDPTLPASGEFLGAMILKADGSRNSTFSREVADAFGDGSVLGRPRLRGRSIVLELLVLGYTCQGVDYGLEWLRRLFESEICACSSTDPCESCTGKSFTLRVFCGDDEDCDTGIRTWDSTGPVDGITVVEDDALKDCCCVARKVTVTIQTESPYSFNCESIECDVDADEEAYSRCFDWGLDCLDCAENCCDRCGYDALCTCFPIIEPEITLLTNDCFCEPLQKTIQCCCIENVGQSYDTALRLDIYSGVNDTDDAFTEVGLRNMRVRVFDNPDGLPCITDEDSYNDWQAVCDDLLRFEFQVAYVPSDATLTIDGRKERVYLTCDGVCRPFGHVVTNQLGSIFPFVTRCNPIMVCVEFDTNNTQFDSGVNILPSHITVTSYRRWFN